MNDTERLIDIVTWHNSDFTAPHIQCRIIRQKNAILRSSEYNRLTTASIRRLDGILTRSHVFSSYISPTHTCMMFRNEK